MGTVWPNPGYKCHIKGNLLCTSYPANPFYELRFKVGNGWPGCEIGASSDILAFWTSEYGYTSLRASDFSTMSDSTLKKNIISIKNPLERLLKIRSVYYAIENNKMDGNSGEKILQEKHNFGFLSQQIRDLFPEADITIKNQDGLVLMEYNQIIPIAVAAIQEQQKIIDSIRAEMSNLKEQIKYKNSIDFGNLKLENLDKMNQLEQNNPNPFSESTEIKFIIDNQDFRNASMVIFDLKGELITKFDILQCRRGIININGNSLKPGMYIYSLIVNQREVDSKRMIMLN